MEMEDDKRDLISREISKFRDTHKVRRRTDNLSQSRVTVLPEGKKFGFLLNRRNKN